MIEVLKPGFFSSIQDLGRFSMVEYGVPISGSMDSIAASRANLTLGNDISEAVLEITMTGPTLLFQADTCICISGAEVKPTLQETLVPMDDRIKVKAGEVLSIGRVQKGLRSYLAVQGGLQTNSIFESRSWYNGISNDIRLKKMDNLPMDKAISECATGNKGVILDPIDLDTIQIEVFPGPEFHLLSDFHKAKLSSNTFSVSQNNSRMAYALNEAVENDLSSIITSPVMPGTVQLTPSGKLFILMRDCQTTGGYPRILQLSEKAICILSQKFTGDIIQFNLKDL